MIMLDRVEGVGCRQSDGQIHVEACQSLASEMCRDIFDRLGLDVQPIENALRGSPGRVLTYVFPTGTKLVSSMLSILPASNSSFLKQVREDQPREENSLEDLMSEEPQDTVVHLGSKDRFALMRAIFEKFLSEESSRPGCLRRPSIVGCPQGGEAGGRRGDT